MFFVEFNQFNFGFHDQLLALTWVYNYIENFNGDSQKITISGESAGGASSLYLHLNTDAQKMIFGTIAQSSGIIFKKSLIFLKFFVMGFFRLVDGFFSKNIQLHLFTKNENFQLYYNFLYERN